MITKKCLYGRQIMEKGDKMFRTATSCLYNSSYKFQCVVQFSGRPLSNVSWTQKSDDKSVDPVRVSYEYCVTYVFLSFFLNLIFYFNTFVFYIIIILVLKKKVSIFIWYYVTNSTSETHLNV